MLEILETVSLALIPLFLLLDFVHRRRRFATDRHWRLRALACTAAILALSLEVAGFWGERLAGASLLDLSGRGIWAGAGLGIVVYELGHYAYHRAAHAWDWLWRVHQFHHSAESLDAFGANWIHPLDAAVFTSIASLVFVPLLGLSPEAAGLAAFWVGFNAIFQHANLATPRWLGWILQRPESHLVHHARWNHRSNYADLPLVDWLFGTLFNPRHEDIEGLEVGFHAGASTRLRDLLLLRDVAADVAGKASARAEDVGEFPRPLGVALNT